MIALDDLITALRRGGAAPLTDEVVLADRDEELIIVRRVVADHQVAVGIKAGRSAAEGLRAVRIRKDVVAVAVALGDGQRRVERHPENEV